MLPIGWVGFSLCNSLWRPSVLRVLSFVGRVYASLRFPHESSLFYSRSPLDLRIVAFCRFSRYVIAPNVFCNIIVTRL